jgi:hypothetical protein
MRTDVTLLQGGTVCRTFSLFERRARTLLFSKAVGSAELPFFMGREASWCQQIRKAWSLKVTWVCGVRFLTLRSKLKIPMGQQDQWA